MSADLFVPYTTLGGRRICDAQEPADGFECTRPEGHGGRHRATGMPAQDGTESVYAVWADE